MNSPCELLKEADASFNNKDYANAETQYTTLIEMYNGIDTDFKTRKLIGQALNNRGQIKYFRVDFTEAVIDYTEALQLDNTSEVIFYNRGLIHYRLGRFSEAISDFNFSLKLNPNFKDSIDALRIAKMEQHKNGDHAIC